MGILWLSSFNLSNRMVRSINRSGTKVMSTAKASYFKNNLYHHLENQYGNPEYNVVFLSQDMGMSRSHLFRKCKQVFGQSPVALIRHYRLEQSREFLKSGIYNVSEAAYLSGFNSLSHFSKCFKKKYRELPSKWID